MRSGGDHFEWREAMNNLCDECETVSHCLKNGCISKQPPATKEVVELLFLARTMNMAASKALTILQETEAKMIAAASADQSEVIYQLQMLSGAWIDQSKHSYEYNKKRGHTVRIVYAAPQPKQPAPEESSAVQPAPKKCFLCGISDPAVTDICRSEVCGMNPSPPDLSSGRPSVSSLAAG